MIIRVTLKDPDTMSDSVTEAYRELPKPIELTDVEWYEVRSKRIEAATAQITDTWMEYGEYLTVDFDLEKMTATVVTEK